MRKNVSILSVAAATVLLFVACQRTWDNPYNQADYNTVPTAVITITRVPGVDVSTFIFDASGSSDIEDKVDDLEIRWDWESDGTWDTDWKTAKTDTHTFATGGKKVVRAALKDKDGGVANGFRELGVDFTTATCLDSFVFFARVDASPVAFAEGDLVRWDSDDDGTWDTDWDSVTTDTFGYDSEGEYTIRLEVKYADGSTEQVATKITALLHPGMKIITGGTFQMGSDFENDTLLNSNPGMGFFDQEQPVHPVTVSSFWMDSTEVTQADYENLMGNNPSRARGDLLPVDRAGWYEAALYCNARSKRDGLDTVYRYSGITDTAIVGAILPFKKLTGVTVDISVTGYRLPTEAEWEYACRAGGSGMFPFGDDHTLLGNHCWFEDNSGLYGHPVAEKEPNAFGLYDMLGNVGEWCNDWYADSFTGLLSQTVDPVGPAAMNPAFPGRVRKGGAFDLDVQYNRPSYRSWLYPYIFYGHQDTFGFRVVLQSH